MHKNKENSFKSEIDVYLRPNDQVYAPYYPNEDVHLCMELVNYLTSYTIDLNLKNTFTINLYCGTGQNADLFQDALKNTFEDKIHDAKVMMRRKTIVAVVSLLVGFLFGISAFYLTGTSLLFTSFLAIVSWVFIWYAVESYSFDHKQLQVSIQSYKQLETAEINSLILAKEDEIIQ